MLQIQSVSKTYRTGPLIQQALSGVSLNLRDNEFVAILGQSGSGKTTLLNVIGGLDRYDSGDLIINGISTKQYNARDWDSYRNHTVGFVFQSYNLIPHQTILANVELALTISGISKSERTRRAREALDKVGLSQHVHKKPSQLSGGQMQRVAIARALVNDPDILLADEPTGALDSDTSIQVMDLLKEVAVDRLVVMVTHNPELAEQYATRIVRLKDGQIVGDTDPYEPGVEDEGVHRNMGKSSMSFLTALALSFNNLWTKKVRTLLVAFAGSIGIIGIAMILSMSNGVDVYIQNVEEDTLKSYPLQITDTAFNLANFVPRDEEEEETQTKDVREWRTVTNMCSRVSTNDLAALRAYLEGDGREIYDHVQAIEYDYNLTPQIFAEQNGEIRQVNPDRSFAAMGFSAADNMSGLFSSFSSTDTFHAMPAQKELYLNQYDVKAGRWPEQWNECVLVLTQGGRVSDLTLYTLGLKDPKELEAMVKAFVEGRTTETDEREQSYAYDEFLGITFRLVPPTDLYTYDETYSVWTDRSEDQRFLRTVVQRAETISIVGVVQPKEDASSPSLSMGVAYPAELTRHMMDTAEQSPITMAQLQDPETNVFNGKAFGDTSDREDLDLSSIFSVDEDAISDAFGFDLDPDSFDFSSMDLSGMDFDSVDLSNLQLDPSQLQITMPELKPEDLGKLLDGVNVDLSRETLEQLFSTLMDGYLTYAGQDPATDYAQLPNALEQYLASDEAGQILQAGISDILAQSGAALVTPEELTEIIQNVLAGYPQYLSDNGLTPEEGVPLAYLGPYLQSEEAQALLSQSAAQLGAKLAQLALTPEALSNLSQSLMDGYTAYAAQNELPDPAQMQSSFSAYLETEEGRALMEAGLGQIVDTDTLAQNAQNLMADYSKTMGDQLSKVMAQVMSQITDTLSRTITNSLSSFTGQLAENFQSAFQFDPDAMAEAFQMNMDPEELRDLMTSLMSTQELSYDGNLRKLGYADENKPTSITIYPTDFAGKTAVKTILDDYNTMQQQAGEEEKVVTFTDMVDTLMSSVTDIVDAISTVLIAFVAISLVVSSVMIGVITYISVLERKKEIGILRAIGASKGNISQVFNAETFIIGLLAGLMGVGITYLLLIPANHIIHALTNQPGINAILPVGAAAALVALSTGLTMIGGIIPSRKAARSDPVAALRSE